MNTRLKSYTKVRPPRVGDDVVTTTKVGTQHKPVDLFQVMNVDLSPDIIQVQPLGFRTGMPAGELGYINQSQIKRVT